MLPRIYINIIETTICKKKPVSNKFFYKFNGNNSKSYNFCYNITKLEFVKK